MKVIITGANGRMGQNMIRLTEAGTAGGEIAALVSKSYENNDADKKYSSVSSFNGDADVVIDFSNHLGTTELLDACIAKGLPVVVATTGHTAEEKEAISNAAQKIPVFYSANMSVGVAVLSDLCKRAAAAFPDADIEIVEKHHNQKLDVPSGTALIFANRIKEARTEAEFNIGRHENGKRTKNEIGIHSLRMGSEVGTHEIIIATGTETLTLKHEAENRALFAEGALRAAAWLIGKNAGLYNMQDMLQD